MACSAQARRTACAVVAMSGACLLAACGAASWPGGRTGARAGSRQSAGAFAWLRPQPVVAGWLRQRIPGGATLPYPPGWRLVHGDAGTATVARLDARGRYVGYLNLTPRQGDEQIAGWTRFRPDHNAREGDRLVRVLAGASGLRFRTGRGACVRDTYTTITRSPYVELACLVVGARGGVVIVGASPPDRWREIAPVIERAISSMTT
ncbi:MAG: hypothetical protein ACYC91_17400 [Solirubrobacteraceae bacterium]